MSSKELPTWGRTERWIRTVLCWHMEEIVGMFPKVGGFTSTSLMFMHRFFCCEDDCQILRFHHKHSTHILFAHMHLVVFDLGQAFSESNGKINSSSTTSPEIPAYWTCHYLIILLSLLLEISDYGWLISFPQSECYTSTIQCYRNVMEPPDVTDSGQTISPELGCYAFETRVSANAYRNPSPHPKWKGKSLRVCVCVRVCSCSSEKNSKRGLLTKAARRLVQFPFLQQLKHEVLLYVFFFFQYDSESYCCPNIYLQFLSFNQPCFERSFSHKTREEKTDNQFHSEPLRATNSEPSKGLTDKVKEIQKLEMIEICFLP